MLFNALLFSVVLLFCILACRNAEAASLGDQHDPTVTIGTSKLRNLLLFVWDHRCAMCGAVYRKTVVELDPEIAAGALTVMLVQTLPSQAADNQADVINAASLLLAPSPAYAGIVASWLENGVAAKSTTQDALTADVAKSLRDNWSRDPQTLVAAVTDKARLARAITVLKVWSNEVDRRWPHDSSPLLILNGRTLAQWGVKDARSEDIRRLLLKR